MNNLIKKESIELEKVSFNDSLSEYEQGCESYKQVTSKVDLIDRQAAIDVLETGAELLKRVLDDTNVVGNEREKFAWGLELVELFIDDINDLPSAEPKTKLIAEVKMSKEDIQNAVDNAVEKIKAQMEVPKIKAIKTNSIAKTEQKKKKWKEYDSDENKYDVIKCPCCMHMFSVDSYHWTDNGFVKDDFKFCPNCGADMRGIQR